ncbi:MAG: O-antigen ligase family protein, partial [Acidimicrobiales bacterium]
KLFHKMLPLLPLIVGIALASLPSAMRRGIRLPVLLTCFVVFTVASYTWTTDRFGVIRHDIEFVAVAAAGWLVGAVFDRETLCRIFAIAMRVFVVVTIASLVFAHHWATVPAVDGAPGWHGPFGHKNGLGLEMAIGLIALWYERPQPRSRWLWLAVGVGLLLGSESGAGLAVVMIVVAVGVQAASARAAIRQGARRIVTLLTVFAVILGGFVAISDFPAAASLLGKNSTLTGRTTIWGAVAGAIPARALQGYGFGGVWLSTSGETAKLWDKIGFQVFEAHDAWLDLLLQLGIIGCVLMLLIVGKALIQGWRGFRDGIPGDAWAWLLLVALIADGAVESGPLAGQGIFLVAMVAASFERAHRTSRHHRPVVTPVTFGLPRTTPRYP